MIITIITIMCIHIYIYIYIYTHTWEERRVTCPKVHDMM